MPEKPEARKHRIDALKSAPPPPDQLCENECGQPARHHLMRSVKTPTGSVLRWYWCCSDHYKKCPALLKRSEVAKRRTTLERYGVEHHMQDPRFIEMRRETSVERYGVTHAMKLPEFVDKKHQTELERHGSLRTGYDKRVEEFQARTGLAHWNQIPGMGRRIQESIRARWGSHYSKNEEWKREQKECTGYEHPRQNPECEAKRAKTCIERYGMISATSNPEVQRKTRNTSMARYGAPHFFQSPVHYLAQLKVGYARKPFTLPSGKIVQVQGYEPQVLQELLDSGITEEDILFGLDCPSFFYEFEGKLHRYYPDMLIVSRNLIIEVKSPYTYQKSLAQNQAKGRAVLAEGYQFEFRIHRPEPAKRHPKPRTLRSLMDE